MKPNACGARCSGCGARSYLLTDGRCPWCATAHAKKPVARSRPPKRPAPALNLGSGPAAKQPLPERSPKPGGSRCRLPQPPPA